jgi:hypothetical protein
LKKFNLKEYIGNNPLLKEAIDFPEMEDEFEGAMDAMVVEPEVYLQDIINASSEEIVSDDYYEIMNAVEQGVYNAEEAVKLAKAWAQDKLSGLAENKPIKEYSWDEEDEDDIEDIYGKEEYDRYTSQDGWDEDALEDVGLMELISEVERLAYELRTARRGSYAQFGDTGEELKTYLEELGRSFTQISNNM